MRSFQALALAFSLGATAGASSARAPKPTKLKSASRSASATAEKVMSSSPPSTKPVQPAPSFGVFGSAGVRF